MWLKDIAPSNELRKWFGHDYDKWYEFQKRYIEELKNKNQLINQIKELEKEYNTLTLVYGAKDEEHNNAVVLRDKIKLKD